MKGSRIPEDEARSELENILRSLLFQRSERPSQFLRYICEKSFAGESSQINEHLIGIEVFGRGANYSPTEDSIVRRTAYTLRHKLDEYYSREGQSDSILISLPQGHYVPSFQRRSDEQVFSHADHQTSALPGRPLATRRLHRGILGMTTALVLVSVGWLLGRNSSLSSPPSPSPQVELGPATREFWGPWLSATAGPLVCFSNPRSIGVKHFQQPAAPTVAPMRFLASPAETERLRGVFGLPPGGYVYLAPSVSLAKMGEAVGASFLASLFGHVGLRIRPTESRFLGWEDFREADVILLGHNESNRWIDSALESRPFQLEPAEGNKRRRIINLAPEPGEAKEYLIEYPNENTTVTVEYALISMTPGIDEYHELVVISGLNTGATQIAAEFLSDEMRLRGLLERMKRTAPTHKGCWYFQGVLKVEVRDKFPASADLVALRVLSGS